jgi:flagellum-specific ATP synthase
MPRVKNSEAVNAANNARSLLSTYREIEDLLRVGAYSPGSDPQADSAIQAHDKLRKFLVQGVHESVTGDASDQLKQVLYGGKS